MSDPRQSFPSNRNEALALAFVMKTTGVDVTPEDFCRKYLDALSRIAAEAKAIDEEKKAISE